MLHNARELEFKISSFAHSAWSLCQSFKDAQPDVVDQYSEKLRRLGLDKFTVQKELTAMGALQSERAGVTGVYTRVVSGEAFADMP